ncbi:MAG: UDP-N-acetylglucosamine--N-acetylmuramyl-(pentapeptide) pyrophosphoryl-undecaprenol N-acetylglucosamine transferase [bacterium]|nr:UDP-N-acetylglucosamine--N-acetylmuramyl-(pentapeptide) pyrophosphoryl-undecaprenol N-acetylglucosamine transferase [bacterium]
MKIVLIGGHLSPALSVLEALGPNAEVLFIGRKYALEGDSALSLEYATITGLKIPFVELNTGRLQRKLTKHTIPSLLKLPFGITKAFLTLSKFKPDVVVGFGGYVSIPVVFCAYLLKIPVVIHEQTLEAGLANKFLAKFATKICISWPTSAKYFPKEKVVLTGNPIRKFTINNSQLTINNKLPTIYITGGSSGSHFINVLIKECLEKLLQKYNVIHQTGDAQEFHDYDHLEEIKNSLSSELKNRYILKKFVDPSEIGTLLNKASFVISRSGINTITELLYFEKPALLVPIPYSQNNEQLKNAKFLEKIGLGKILLQNEIDEKKLSETIISMLDHINNYKIDKGELKNLPVKNAAQNIIEVINYVAKEKISKIS